MSDDEMLPDSQRGFAPTIRGVAHSNAKVTVSQHGYVIYETFVSPGRSPSAISPHLAERRSGGEGDREQWRGAYLYPALFRGAIYAARRARQIQFSVGRYHSGESVRSPEFLQGTLFYGLTAGFTLYGGTQLARTIRRGRWARAAVLASSDRWEGCHPCRHPYAVGQALYGPFAARSVSEKFCQLGHCVQPRQLSLLVKRLLRFCRSQRP